MTSKMIIENKINDIDNKMTIVKFPKQDMMFLYAEKKNHEFRICCDKNDKGSKKDYMLMTIIHLFRLAKRFIF